MKQLKCIGFAQASVRLVNLYPGEREVVATVDSGGMHLWSSHRDAEGKYPSLGGVTVPGFDGGEKGGFGFVKPVDVPGFKGVVTAIPSGINYFPIAAFLKDSKEKGWSFTTSGAPAVAALMEDVNGDGVPEIFLTRKDGFVNILKLADGSSLGLLNLGEPILGMAVLKGKDGKPRLAVGTQFSVRVFAVDPTGTGFNRVSPTATSRPGGPESGFSTNAFKDVGRNVVSVRSAAFAGPGGKDKDRVFVVDSAGRLTVFALKPN